MIICKDDRSYITKGGIHHLLSKLRLMFALLSPSWFLAVTLYLPASSTVTFFRLIVTKYALSSGSITTLHRGDSCTLRPSRDQDMTGLGSAIIRHSNLICLPPSSCFITGFCVNEGAVPSICFLPGFGWSGLKFRLMDAETSPHLFFALTLYRPASCSCTSSSVSCTSWRLGSLLGLTLSLHLRLSFTCSSPRNHSMSGSGQAVSRQSNI